MPSTTSVLDNFLAGSFLLPWSKLTPSWLGAAPGSKPPGNSFHLPGARAKSLSPREPLPGNSPAGGKLGCTSCSLQSWDCPKNLGGNTLKIRVGTGVPLSFPCAWLASGFILPHAGTAASAALGFGVPGGLVALQGGTGSPRTTIHLLPAVASGPRGLGKAGAGRRAAGLAWEPVLGWEKAPCFCRESPSSFSCRMPGRGPGLPLP